MFLRKFPGLTVLAVTAFGASSPASADIDKDAQSDILMVALPASAYLVTLSRKDRDGAWDLSKTLAATASSTLLLNALIEKDSPNGESSDAFPSGHTSIAFGSAAFLQKRYGWKTGVPAYAVAAYVGWLRVDTDNHDAADVLGGAAVGILSAHLLTRALDENVQVSAWSRGDAIGVQVRYQW